MILPFPGETYTYNFNVGDLCVGDEFLILEVLSHRKVWGMWVSGDRCGQTKTVWKEHLWTDWTPASKNGEEWL